MFRSDFKTIFTSTDPQAHGSAVGPARRAFTPAFTPAFTLVELMISIAMVILLMVGINKVFQYTTKAVGQGQAINAAVRDSRAAQTVMAQDFAAIVPNGPNSTNSACIILRSAAQYAFRDRADEAGDRGIWQGGPPPGYGANYRRELTIDINGDGREGDPNVPGEIIPWAEYNYRNHRVDTISFFARDKFPRQTGNFDTYVADQASNEAWIWYGHLWLPDNNGGYPFNISGDPVTFPGAGDSGSVNPNNYYSSQFVLGRVAMLLVEKSSDDSFGTITDNSGALQRFINRTNPYTFVPAVDLEPLCYTAPAKTAGSDTVAYTLQSARFDVAATSIAGFREKLKSFLAGPAAAGQAFWWNQMMSGVSNSKKIGIALTPGNGTRFQCNPFIDKPVTAAKMANLSPYFLPGCSQFIVEFAGDYLKQENDPSAPAYGSIINPTPDPPGTGDGVLDFAMVRSDPNVPTSSLVKQTIWYGFPRRTTAGAGLRGPLPGAPGAAQKGDVVPVRDWIEAAGMTVPLGTWFEHMNFTAPSAFVPSASYLNPPGAGAGGLVSNAQYIAAWDPNNKPPKLIRITINLIDTGGQLPDGQTYQYVFPVPTP